MRPLHIFYKEIEGENKRVHVHVIRLYEDQPAFSSSVDLFDEASALPTLPALCGTAVVSAVMLLGATLVTLFAIIVFCISFVKASLLKEIDAIFTFNSFMLGLDCALTSYVTLKTAQKKRGKKAEETRRKNEERTRTNEKQRRRTKNNEEERETTDQDDT